MFEKPLKPQEILKESLEASEAKASGGFLKLAVLGVLAGAFIAFAAEGSTMAAFNLLSNPDTYGLGRVMAGALFGVGLMMVILCGGELFTGNTLMIGGVLTGRIRLGAMMRNWGIVYVTNLLGSLLIVWMMYHSGLLHSGGDLLGAMTVRMAAAKTGLSFLSAFVLGVMCNWLVCLAVWLAFGAESMAGKILGIFFPIWLFVTSGFEHSVANMYYIPMGMLAKNTDVYVQKAMALGTTSEALEGLNMQGFLVDNLVPVTLGNIVGGCLFVSMAYLLAYRTLRPEKGVR